MPYKIIGKEEPYGRQGDGNEAAVSGKLMVAVRFVRQKTNRSRSLKMA